MNGYRPKEYRLTNPTREDVRRLAPLVRPDEVREIWSLARLTPAEALERALERGGEWGGDRDGGRDGKSFLFALHGPAGILGMGGAREIAPGIGVPWFIGADLRGHERFVARHARLIVDGLLARFSVLINVVGDWNRQSLSWLKHVGFTVEAEGSPLGFDKDLFRRFWAAREA